MVEFLRDNRGMALILTILIVSLIVALTLQFNTSMRSNLYAAANLRDGIKLGCIARSGFNGALAVLYEDVSSGNVDTLRETWAHARIFSENSASLFDEGRFLVEIADLSGRIQINQLVDQNGNYNDTQKSLLMRFLDSPEFDLDPEEVENIVDAIKDWIDPDDETTRFGAEDSYYRALEKPYPCKNGPFEFLEELLLVRGITTELFYGTEERPGISLYLSTYGNGKININTAALLVLRALSDGIDQGLAEDMVAYCEDEDNDLSDFTWYKRVPGMGDVSIPDSLLTVSSSYFEITSEGLKGTMSKRTKGVVERKEGTLQVLSWKVE
ncbi:MAG: type II secretion system minor pseudopilin GspK [Desulfobacterales bacterium]|nr:type II secretion system minor pseudopilin GspK [Desulfobacterales bacterium]